MNELVAKIKELSNAFFMDAELQTEKGNKAAGTRARKASLELEKLLKNAGITSENWRNDAK